MIPTPPQQQTPNSCFYFLDDSNGFLGGDNETPTPSPTANIFGRLSPPSSHKDASSTPVGFDEGDHPIKPQQ